MKKVRLFIFAIQIVIVISICLAVRIAFHAKDYWWVTYLSVLCVANLYAATHNIEGIINDWMDDYVNS